MVTVSGLIGLMHSLGHGDKVNDRTRDVERALNAKAAVIKRRRATDPSSPIKRSRP